MTSYTRYADDLTFSSNDRRLNHIIPVVSRITQDCGFRVNKKKTRVCRRGGRQLATGIVLNDRLNVPRSIRRNLRAQLHQAREAILRGERPNLDVERIRGLASHIRSVNPQEGIRFIRDVDEIERLVAVGRIQAQ